jgi:hypothetical protein
LLGHFILIVNQVRMGMKYTSNLHIRRGEITRATVTHTDNMFTFQGT